MAIIVKTDWAIYNVKQHDEHMIRTVPVQFVTENGVTYVVFTAAMWGGNEPMKIPAHKLVSIE